MHDNEREIVTRKNPSTPKPMSAATANVLFGTDTSIDMWRPLTVANEVNLSPDMTVSRLELLARVEWVSAALEDYPSVPAVPDFGPWTEAFPVWAEL